MGYSILGFTPNENSPIYLEPSSVENILFNSSSSPSQVAFWICPSLNVNFMFLYILPWYGEGVL